MKKPNFSVALIARNEEETLPRMVASLKEFQERGGDIYVVDTGSTDKTVEIAKALGCKVTAVGDRFLIKIDEQLAKGVNEKFIVEGEAPVVKAGDTLFDFGSARNFLASLPETDMIAMPDCDEIFTKFDIDKLEEVISSGAEQLEYEFVFSHDQLGKPLVKFKHSKFYDRRKMGWGGVIHEILAGNAKRVYLGEDIIKLEHYQNEKTNRSGYLKGLAIDCYLHPDKDRNSHYFAREMLYLGRYKSAIKEFKKHITMGGWGTEISQSMMFIGDCYSKIGDYDEMLKWYIKSVEQQARREPLMRLAEYYFRKQMHAQVVVYCEASLSITQLPFYSNHQPYYEHIPHELLYISYWWMGEKEKSKKHYKIALSYFPNNPKYIHDGKFYEETPEQTSPKKGLSKYDASKFTGERFIPGINRPDMEAEHYARYNFASKYTEGKIVLDAACGSGYGEDILKAKEYLGVDISNNDCQTAIIQDLEKGIDLDIKPDVVVSFETIEHLENPHNFLEWVKNNAKEFIFSIPVSMPSEFHKQVYTVDEIKDLIGSYFKDVDYFEQNSGEIVEETDNPRYIVGIARNKITPKISFIIPTLGREEGLKRCMDSIEALNYPKDKIEVIIKQDSFENRIGVPKLVKQGVEESTGEWIVFASNDTEFTPESINEALAVGENGYVAFNTGEIYADNGNINEHFMIRRDIITKTGDVFDTEFYHTGCDNLLYAKMNKLGIFNRAEKAIVNHYHFTKGYEKDDVYNLGWKDDERAKDRALLDKKLKEL